MEGMDVENVHIEEEYYSRHSKIIFCDYSLLLKSEEKNETLIENPRFLSNPNEIW